MLISKSTGYLLIDGLVAGLKKFDDKTLRQDLGNDEAKIMELVQKYFYCG